MTQEAAERFAAALLRQFGKDKEFQFELPEGHNIELVTAALKKAGCLVSIREQSNAVTVQVPQAQLG